VVVRGRERRRKTFNTEGRRNTGHREELREGLEK
jgi:hypothetical protein